MTAIALLCVGVEWIVTDKPEPPLPKLLQGLGSSGGSTDGCLADDADGTTSMNQFGRQKLAWEDELGRRLESQYPPGSDAEKLVQELRTLHFMVLPPCKDNPRIRLAIFQQQGGFIFGPHGLPMFATIWWKKDEAGRLLWARGMVAFDGL